MITLKTQTSINLAPICRVGATLGLLSILATGCSTTWSAADKAKLSNITVAPVVVGKDAYKKPDATDSPGMAQSIPTMTGGGLIPSLLGSAIDATVMVKQQKKFEAENAQYFPALQEALTAPPTNAVQEALCVVLGEHGFFGSRLTPESSNTFATEILSYGLQRSPLSNKGEYFLRMRIIARITLKLSGGSQLFQAQLTGVASSARLASEILADVGFLDENTKEAAHDLASRLIEQLDMKLTPKQAKQR